ncbi:MAG: cysteine--tRNA ligase [Rhodospirillales bacterium]|nr:cysteine--tRNA ligase [Alphaproteobacteria bacterium]MCB9986895.1 cysteine--tRNA ligase [Rhodospirillales bacterium]USO08327.1 MAG: cysteine--tRNA ligase [Rhodospirillales bacterium]
MDTTHTLKLTNSLGRRKQVFEPLDPARIGVYVCGPTVYNYAHIGNARPAVVFDVLRRILTLLYGRVEYVSNITDIDDKIMAAAQETGQPIDAITRKYTDIYNADMAALGVLAPDRQPRATDTIPEMIALIESLVARGHAYEATGHVLFHVPSFPDYGRLSGRNRDEQIAGARVDVAPYKKDPADFVLWKPSSDDQPGWESPWGRGRPGWHIECSAMAEKFLGRDFDIHGGGLDLTFPHHENEIAQSVCAHDDTGFARVWLHNGFLAVEGEKMSKSIGNVLLVHDLIAHAPGEAIRFALLATHYRQPFDWTQAGLEEAVRTLSRFYAVIEAAGQAAEGGKPDAAFIDALCDDLNTPLAIARLHALAKAGDGAALRASAQIMGLLAETPAEWRAALERTGRVRRVDAQAVEKLVAERNAARAAKNWAESDRLRDVLAAMGVTLKDGPGGTEWYAE